MDDTSRPSSRARGAVDGKEIFVGDTVMIRGTVLESVAGVGANVELFSKTDQYQGWIREKDLRWVLVDGDLPPEPGDGTWLLSYVDDNPRIFHRDDAEGHSDRDVRRHDRHWWDAVAQEWIDWPAAVQRGAARTGARRMTVEEEDL